MTIKEVKCCLEAIPLFVRSKFKVWVPHVYQEVESYPHSKIWVSAGKFRVFDGSLNHYPGEHLEHDVTLCGYACKYCGKKIMDWSKGQVPILPREKE